MPRLKVELKYGYVSYDAQDEEKAWQLYKDQGVRIFLCDDIFDNDGVLLSGPPVVHDLIPKEDG